MWIAAVSAIILSISCISKGNLIGDHVCQSKIIVPEDDIVFDIKLRTVRLYEWCWNIPPRCSVYSKKIVNDTLVIKNNVTKTVTHCCPDYQQVNDRCEFDCSLCKHGVCTNGKCICDEGWSGLKCDTPCLLGQFGTNCTDNYCNCSKYVYCDAEKPEDCDCVTGWLEDSCKDPCRKAYFGKNCRELCTCDFRKESCSIVDDKCIIKKHGILTTEHIASYLETTVIYEDETTTTVANIQETDYIIEDNFHDYENENLGHIDKGTEGPNIKDGFDKQPTTYSTDDEKIMEADEVENLEEKELRKVLQTTTKTISKKQFIPPNTSPDIPGKSVETVDDSSIERYAISKETEEDVFTAETKSFVAEKEDQHPARYIKNSVLYSISAATAVAILIIVVLMIAIAFRNSKKNKPNIVNKEANTISMYTTSIFQTPLPDPPSFDNPKYVESSRYCAQQNGSDTLETPIICNLNFKNSLERDYKELFYDHPPSTGSYRATSTIDAVSEIDKSPSDHFEPVYDEIPSRHCHGTHLSSFATIPSHFSRSKVTKRCSEVYENNRTNLVDENKAAGSEYHTELYINMCDRTRF